jgi:DNA-binding SARP family transcriptional activator
LLSFPSTKVQELFCFLLLHRKPHLRETLATLFWGDTEPTQAKKYLRKALWQLQATLESSLGPLHGRVIVVENDWVRLNSDFDLWADVIAFEESIRSGRPLDQVRDPMTAAHLRAALQLYEGDLLEGCYQDWCLFERERLQTIYLATLDRLICYSECNWLYEDALGYVAEVLRNDPARERAHRQAMRLHFARGDRGAAIRQYQRCVNALKCDLDVSPSSRTTRLLAKIQAADPEDSLQEPPSEPSNSEKDASFLPEVLEDLKNLRSTLATTLRQVQTDIQKVELVLINSR